MPETPSIPTQFTAPEFQEHDDRPPLPRRTPEPIVRHDYADDDGAPERDAEAVAATPAPAPAPPSDAPPAAGPGPVPLVAGTFTVYSDGAGGYVLVIQTADGTVHHKHLPGRLVKMAEMAMGGSSPLANLFGAG